MAWPRDPMTSYVPGSLPPIKASDLNALQDGVNRAFRGTYSYAGIVVDGTGGNSVTPPPGGVALSARAVGRSQPTPPTPPGVLFADSCVTAFGAVGPDGTLLGGFGIASVARVGAGSYRITTQQEAPFGWAPVGSVNTSLIAVLQIGYAAVDAFTVNIFSFNNGSWQPLDAAFQFIAYAI